jgi:ABC-type glycerol-3-phosphate transport system substrate-binding protein
MRFVLAFLVATALLLTGCGGSSGGSASGGSSDKPTTVNVAVSGGKVTPATHRQDVTKGATVHLVVTSDKADEIHLHGYDIKKDIEAGKPGTLTFTADQTGLFEAELENAGLQLLQFEVR